LLIQLSEKIIKEYRLQVILWYGHHYLYRVTLSLTGYPLIWTPLILYSNFIAEGYPLVWTPLLIYNNLTQVRPTRHSFLLVKIACREYLTIIILLGNILLCNLPRSAARDLFISYPCTLNQSRHLLLVLQENSSFFLTTGRQRSCGDIDKI